MPQSSAKASSSAAAEIAGDDDDVQTEYYRRANHGLSKLFASCAGDPRGSVHRAWGVSLIFVILYFVLAIVESEFRCFFRRC